MPVRNSGKTSSRRNGKWIFAQVLYGVALSVLILLVLGIVGLKIAGVSTLTVLTPSMEPSIMTGDIILVRPTEEPVKVGNVYVGFSPDINALLAHRVIGEGATPGTWVTKGDANTSADTYQFSSEELSQEVVGKIPLLGHVTKDVKRMGLIAFLFIAGGIAYFWIIRSLRNTEQEARPSELEADEEEEQDV